MKRSAPLLFLLLFLFPFSAWANCSRASSGTSALYFSPNSKGCDRESSWEKNVNNCSSIDDIVSCLCGDGTLYPESFCKVVCPAGYYCSSLGYGTGGVVGKNPLSGYCGTQMTGRTNIYHYYLKCNTQTQLDSAVCVNGGYEWNGTSCSSKDSTGYACQTFRKRTDDGRSYMAHIVYKLNYTNRTSEII